MKYRKLKCNVWSKSVSIGLMLALIALGLSPLAGNASELVLPMELAEPNFLGLGIGGYPDYFGSDDYTYGAAPIGRIMIGGERFIKITVNDLRVNVLNHPNWRFGPGLLYRLSRSDVDDEIVRLLPEIDGAVNLGGWGGYTWKDLNNQRKQFGVSGWAYWDVSGTTDGGYTIGANAFGMVPIATPLSLAFGTGTTWGNDDYMNTYFGITPQGSQASGLPVFNAGSGIRDVRLWAIGMIHLSLKWHVGAGLMYSRMLGDAEDSPIVAERGSKSQWVYGVGFMYSW